MNKTPGDFSFFSVFRQEIRKPSSIVLEYNCTEAEFVLLKYVYHLTIGHA